MNKEKILELLTELLTEKEIVKNENCFSEYSGKYVVVSTDEKKRGIFFGKLKHFDRDKLTIVLYECQMAVYFSSKTKGFNNLAVIGPQEGSRITSPTLEQELTGVSCIILATDEATNQWKKCLWDE